MVNRHPPMLIAPKTISHIGSLGSSEHSNLFILSIIIIITVRGRLKRIIKIIKAITLQHNEYNWVLIVSVTWLVNDSSTTVSFAGLLLGLVSIWLHSPSNMIHLTKYSVSCFVLNQLLLKYEFPIVLFDLQRRKKNWNEIKSYLLLTAIKKALHEFKIMSPKLHFHIEHIRNSLETINEVEF